jgi:hypothetical protein
MKNLFLLFVVTLAFGLTSCEKEELESEIVQPQTTTDTTGTNTTSNTTAVDLHIYDANATGSPMVVIDYTSPLYDIVDKDYYVYSENDYIQPIGRNIIFKTTGTSTGKYDLFDSYNYGQRQWRTIDKAGNTFAYDYLGDKTYTYARTLTIANYDSISGDVLLTFGGPTSPASDTIVLKLK